MAEPVSAAFPVECVRSFVNCRAMVTRSGQRGTAVPTAMSRLVFDIPVLLGGRRVDVAKGGGYQEYEDQYRGADGQRKKQFAMPE